VAVKQGGVGPYSEGKLGTFSGGEARRQEKALHPLRQGEGDGPYEV